MRKHLTAAAVLLLAAACSGHNTTPPAASRPATPAPSTPAAPEPSASGTVHGDQTTFTLTVAATRTTKSFTDGTFQAQKAPAGQQLIVVQLKETNTGNKPGELEHSSSSNPVTLTDTAGKTYQTDISWALDDSINPGLSKTIPYVFPTPEGAKPAFVTVLIADAAGAPSTVVLKI